MSWELGESSLACTVGKSSNMFLLKAWARVRASRRGGIMQSRGDANVTESRQMAQYHKTAKEFIASGMTARANV